MGIEIFWGRSDRQGPVARNPTIIVVFVFAFERSWISILGGLAPGLCTTLTAKKHAMGGAESDSFLRRFYGALANCRNRIYFVILNVCLSSVHQLLRNLPTTRLPTLRIRTRDCPILSVRALQSDTQNITVLMSMSKPNPFLIEY